MVRKKWQRVARLFFVAVHGFVELLFFRNFSDGLYFLLRQLPDESGNAGITFLLERGGQQFDTCVKLPKLTEELRFHESLVGILLVK
jgi:hypothetical protein